MSPVEVAADYGLQTAQVESALQFYAEHGMEIDSAIAAEAELENQANSNQRRHG